MNKIAVLLKGAHKAGTTVQLMPDDIVAHAEVVEGVSRIEFPHVLPTYDTHGLVNNMVYSVGITNALDGEAHIVYDRLSGLPIRPNAGDVFVTNPDRTPEDVDRTAVAGLSDDEIKAVHTTIEMELYPCQSQERASAIASYVRNVLVNRAVAGNSEYDTGMGTTPGMWEMVSDLLEGAQLPKSASEAVRALAQGRADVVPRQD